MPIYRVYPVTKDDHLAGVPISVDCGTDQEALSRARQFVNGKDVEVWQEKRRVGRILSTHR